MQALSKPEYNRWINDYTLIESDGHGPKVMRCANGDYIKFFRIKHVISFSRLVNPAMRFCNNARRLKKLGFNTISPIEIWHIPHMKRWAVRYVPVEGDSLKDLLKKYSLSEKTIDDFGILIKDLHTKGVYFRSLHLGNVVLRPDGQLGLIDILDCRFRWFGLPLNNFQRQRNFSHLFRYADARFIEELVRKGYEKSRTGNK